MMKQPKFWAKQTDPYTREAAPVTRALLTPLSWVYGQGFRLKKSLANPANVAAFVICVGNLTVGGSGKTPLVKLLRNTLSDKGYKVATLSRGYGGRLKGPLRVDTAKHTAKDVGDEPLMLAQSGETWIGGDRHAAALEMVGAGIEVIIMDDGFQNWNLHKDFNILVFDAGDPIGNGYLIPKGPLREPVADGVRRADAIVLMGQSSEQTASINFPNKTVLNLHIEVGKLDPTKRYLAFAGIGRPRKFFDSLAQTGATICDGISYSDHYVYKKGDLSFLHKLAEDYDAQLITTEKDWVRLDSDQRDDIEYLPIEIAKLTDLDALLAQLIEKLPDKSASI